MKILVPQHSSLPFVSWKEDYCAVAVDSKDLQSVFSVEWHTCQVHSHTGGWKRRLSHSYSSTRREGKTVFLSLSCLYQPSGVRILPRDTWEPIKHIPIFLITIVNILESKSPVSSDAAQITGILIPLSVTLHTYNSCLGTDRRGARDNWKTASYQCLSN